MGGRRKIFSKSAPLVNASKETAEFRRGFLVLTAAEDERPFLVDIDDVFDVSFEVNGGGPAGITVIHGKELTETIVYEELHVILEMLKRASKEAPDDEQERSLEVMGF